MDTEKIAWMAFRLYGSIEAYLLHKSLVRLVEDNEDVEWKGQRDL